MLERGDVILENKSGDKQIVFVRQRRKDFMVVVRDLSANTFSTQLPLSSLLAHTPANTWTQTKGNS